MHPVRPVRYRRGAAMSKFQKGDRVSVEGLVVKVCPSPVAFPSPNVELFDCTVKFDNGSHAILGSGLLKLVARRPIEAGDLVYYITLSGRDNERRQAIVLAIDGLNCWIKDTIDALHYTRLTAHVERVES